MVQRSKGILLLIYIDVNFNLPPPAIPNAKYTPLETYPARSEVEYECTNSRYINKGTNNTRLVCSTLDNG